MQAPLTFCFRIKTAPVTANTAQQTLPSATGTAKHLWSLIEWLTLPIIQSSQDTKDWSRSKHDFVLMDPQGKVIERDAVAHNANALEGLAASVERHVSGVEQVHVGLELNNDALLAWLVVKGYSVFGIQPKSAQRFRDIYRPSGSKDDRIGAFVLAEFVRVNKSRLRPWCPPSKITLELGELLRWREELVQRGPGHNSDTFDTAPS